MELYFFIYSLLIMKLAALCIFSQKTGARSILQGSLDVSLEGTQPFWIRQGYVEVHYDILCQSG
jgi:hypothetical protein